MPEFVIDTSTATFKDQDDNILVEGLLLDLHMTIADIVNEYKEQQRSKEDTYNEVARVFMEKFQPNGDSPELSWGTAMKISIEVQKSIDEEKKS